MLFVAIAVALAVLGGVVYDIAGNNRLPLRLRLRRFRNWAPTALMYALFYMSRYNIAALAASPRVRAAVGLNMEQFGVVISAGFWAYAITATPTGRLADLLGGRASLLLSSFTTALCNIALGAALYAGLQGSMALAAMIALYSANFACQSLGTAAVVKVNASWYDESERGTFSGIFNVAVTSGYYLALGLGGSIVGNPEMWAWQWVFFLPGALLIFATFLMMLTLRDAPPWTDDGYNADAKRGGVASIATTSNTYGTVTHRIDDKLPPPHPPSTSAALCSLLKEPVFASFLAATLFTGWLRDGFVNFCVPFLVHCAYGSEITPKAVALVGSLCGGAVTLGGIFGGLAAGEVSDRCFGGRRAQPLVNYLFRG